MAKATGPNIVLKTLIITDLTFANRRRYNVMHNRLFLQDDAKCDNIT